MKANRCACAALAIVPALFLAACGRSVNAEGPDAGDPPPVRVLHTGGNTLLEVRRPEQYTLARVQAIGAHPELNVTGVVSADISRNVPVVTVASGRIIEVRARLGDRVQKGQLLMRVESADVSSAFSDYRQALADDKLTEAQLARAKALYDKGAIARKDLEIAEDAEAKADVEVAAAVEHLRVLGADKDHPTSIVDVLSPAAGVITDQQVTAASGTQGLASPPAFAISDISHVWILCDVYENDLSMVRLGDYADIRLNAYPKMVLKGRVSNIGAVLDPNIRTAKVRVEVPNPGVMLLGMFVRATFHGSDKLVRQTVPASAVLHLHDRDWVYLAEGPGTFRRIEVQSGPLLPSGQQEIFSGLRPGSLVVKDALQLEATLQP
jgi:membrane fusion protein, heavy metal efflux system